MELKEIRKIFYEDMTSKKKDFVIRIRKSEDLIYYNGIKIFEIRDNRLKISSNIFELNDTFLEEHKEDLSNEYSRNKIFKALAKVRLMLLETGYIKLRKKMLVRYEKSGAESYKNREEDIIKNKELILKNVKKSLGELVKEVKVNDSCINKNGNKMDCCSIKENLMINCDDAKSVKLDKMVSLINIEYVLLNEFTNFKWSNQTKVITNKSGWKKPTILIFDTVSSPINKLDVNKVNEITSIMKNVVDEYLKVVFEAEKVYQHQFMTNKLVLKQFKQLGIDKLYRFEEEYYTFNSQKKGKIDSVFVSLDGKDIYLIELKVNRDTIKGTNGIHKHFIDMEDLCDPKQGNINPFLSKMKSAVNERRVSLGQEKIKFDRKPNIHFWTIIAYSDKKEKEYIKKEMLDKYKNEANLLRIKKVLETKTGYENRVLTIDKHIAKLEKMNCEVRIYFDAINYDKKIKELTLKGNKFETYYIKNSK